MGHDGPAHVAIAGPLVTLPSASVTSSAASARRRACWTSSWRSSATIPVARHG